MIILYLITKNENTIIKTVILKKPKKKGTILRKMLTTHYDIKEIIGKNPSNGKSVITVISYRKCNEFIPTKLFKNVILVKNRPFLNIKINMHPGYEPTIFAFLLENYFESLASPNITAYQMNLIKTKNGEV